MVAEVAVERLPAHVLDDLAERGEPVVAVSEHGARLGPHAETTAVVLGERGQWLSHVHALAEVRPERVPGVHHLGDAGRVGQQVPHGRGPEAGLGGDQPVGAQVVVGGGIEVDQPLLPQLHHGDRREGLGDGGDPEHRVLGDRGVRGDVCEPVSVEELEAPVADHAHRQTDGRVAVEDPAHPGRHRGLIGPEGPVIRGPDLRVRE